MKKIAMTALGAMTLMAIGSASANAAQLEATCPSVSYRGPVIVASCYNAYMGIVRSSIDTSTCGGPVANVNGQLYCERGGGGYGRGYGGGGYGGGYGGGEGYRRPRYYGGY